MPTAPRGISDILSLDRIVVGLTCSSIDDVFDVAASRLATWAGQGAPALSGPLKAREREVSSAIGGGIAVPCAYVAGTGLAAVLVSLAHPLRHETPDGRPLRAVIILAGPRDSRQRRLRLAQVARLTARGLADHLGDAHSPQDVLARLVLMDAL